MCTCGVDFRQQRLDLHHVVEGSEGQYGDHPLYMYMYAAIDRVASQDGGVDE